jgi:hypothetical protein
MSKRLQVLLDESEWREIHRAARSTRVTIAEWVRQALRAARASAPTGDTGKKLDVIRAAARHAYPTGDIEQMLAEIEHGYLADGPR